MFIFRNVLQNVLLTLFPSSTVGTFVPFYKISTFETKVLMSCKGQYIFNVLNFCISTYYFKVQYLMLVDCFPLTTLC